MAGELILIIEDNEQNLKLVRDILQFKGYRTIEARNAAEGITLAGTQLPELILMDIQLPDMNGLTLLKRLRGKPGTVTVPVVALTAFAMKDDRQRFLDAGFDGYIEKPINVRAFPEQVQHFCRPSGKEGPE
jgi:two-component system, cell cycle response regulator DivK